MNEVMASCHAITYVGNDLIGDPLEIKMFESTKWILDEKNSTGNSMIGGESVMLASVSPDGSDKNGSTSNSYKITEEGEESKTLKKEKSY
jgi:hypothetical protein